MNISGPIASAIAYVFALGSDLIKVATFVRPQGLSSATGLTSTSEVRASCNLLASNFSVQRPTTTTPQVIFERVHIRASELTTITQPSPGDYIEETTSGIRREILSSVQDPTGLLWIFETKRIPGWEDWGDFTLHGTSEDWGDLTAATTFDEYGELTDA